MTSTQHTLKSRYGPAFAGRRPPTKAAQMTVRPQAPRHSTWGSLKHYQADMGERPAGSWIVRKDESQPHGPGNSFWLLEEDRSTYKHWKRILKHPDFEYMNYPDFRKAFGPCPSKEHTLGWEDTKFGRMLEWIIPAKKPPSEFREIAHKAGFTVVQLQNFLVETGRKGITEEVALAQAGGLAKPGLRDSGYKQMPGKSTPWRTKAVASQIVNEKWDMLCSYLILVPPTRVEVCQEWLKVAGHLHFSDAVWRKAKTAFTALGKRFYSWDAATHTSKSHIGRAYARSMTDDLLTPPMRREVIEAFGPPKW